MEQLAYYTDELTRNREKLERFARLGYNWNGYGAEPLSAEVISQAKNLLRELYIQPEIFPTAASTIQLEYEKDNGDYLEFQLNSSGQCEAFKLVNGVEEYFHVPEIPEAINELVEDFYERSF